ncbi:MAG: hypothetical protein AAGM22_16935 [Acidobacteriota bacterium]
MDSDFFDDDFDDGDADTDFDDAELPEEVRAAFQRDMEAFEKIEPSAPLDALRSSGIELPPADRLSDAEINRHLWEGLRGLAFLGIYLHHTDHLSDRELYDHLLDHALRQPVVMMPDNPHFGYHLDLVEGETEEHEHIFLKYYADSETRERWAEQFPATELPPSERRPFDRDRQLPRHAPQEALAADVS